jgi:hypothetical protein
MKAMQAKNASSCRFFSVFIGLLDFAVYLRCNDFDFTPFNPQGKKKMTTQKNGPAPIRHERQDVSGGFAAPDDA